MSDERILLVDDDPAFLKIMAGVLRAEGRELLTAGDGEQGLFEARNNTPDLIILDVNMPKMDGFTLIRHLRSESAFALVPVIFLTDSRKEKDRLKGFQLGADDYLSKGILLEELAARVKNALRRRARISAELGGQVRRQNGTVLRGALDQIGLPSLLTILEMEGKSGTLGVRRETGGQTARILLHEGRVFAVRIDDKDEPKNTDAVAALLAWSGGEFEFSVGQIDCEDEIGEPTTNLLMTAAYLLDETPSLVV